MWTDLVPLKDSIATRLLRVVFSFYLILAVTVTGAHIAAEYVHTKNLVLQELEILEQTFQPSLKQALWELNKNQLQSTLTGIMQLPNVVGIEIVNPEGIYLGEMGEVLHLSHLASTNNTDKNQSDIFSSSGLFGNTFQVHYLRGDTSFLVGVVTIYSSRKIVIDKLKFSVISLIVSAIINIIGFWILFLLISRYLLSRPLAELTRATEQLQLDNLENVKIDIHTKGNNELKILGNAFTGMVRNLLQTRSELYKHKESLEIRVAERTAELNQSRELYKKLYKDTLKTEELYQSLLESTPDAIVTYDLEGKVQYVNSAFVRTFGWTLEEVSDEVPYTPDSEKKATTDTLNELMKTGCPVSDFETQRYTRDGKIIDVSISASLFHDHEGQPAGILVILRDITDHKRWEKTLKIAKEKAERASQAKSTFLANMSHELRTPMTAILGYSELMQRDTSLPPEHHEHLDTINRNGEHLLALINNVLAISKIEAGQTTFESTTFDLRALLLDLEKLFDSSMDAKGLQFEVIGIDAVPRYVATDENKLRQVLVNLLGNAVKFTEQGGVTMRVAAEDGTAEGMRLKVEVADTGVGIAEDEMDKVFASFEQTASGRAKKSGTGLGLALSRDYARMMGGDITVASKEGKGSTFYLNIGIREGNASDIKEKTFKPRVIGLAPSQEIPRVLVAEDMEDNRTLLVRILKMVGFQVREAANGREALEIFHEWQPHFIWMDIRMPMMDGLEATWCIKETAAGKSTIVAAFTAHALEEERERILAAGCDDFVRKPFREQEIFEVMAKHLGLKYVYEDRHEDVAPIKSEVEIGPEQLETLPADLRRQLYNAMVELDRKRALTLIEKIKTIDVHIAWGLEVFVRNLAFEPLLDLLEKSEQPEQEDSHD